MICRELEAARGHVSDTSAAANYALLTYWPAPSLSGTCQMALHYCSITHLSYLGISFFRLQCIRTSICALYIITRFEIDIRMINVYYSVLVTLCLDAVDGCS